MRYCRAGDQSVGEVQWPASPLTRSEVDGDGEPGLRLKSANAEYADYTALAGDVHIVGKVLWTVRKV